MFDCSPEEAEFGLLIVGESGLVEDDFGNGLPAYFRELGQLPFEGFFELLLAVKTVRLGHFPIVGISQPWCQRIAGTRTNPSSRCWAWPAYLC